MRLKTVFKNDNTKICLIYVILFFFFVFKMFFYINENFNTPDFQAQISYVVYMELNPQVLIPDYSDIPMYTFTEVATSSNDVIYKVNGGGNTCYLGHPPFYYKLMAMFDCVSVGVDGDVFLNCTKLRICNALITSLTMLLVMNIGYKLLSKNNSKWYLHLFFYSIATSLPLYAYLGSSVNNDNLCNLGIVVFWCGLVNYVEEGYSYKTFWLVALGISISVLSKLTAGLIVLLVTFIVIFVDIIKNRKIGIVFNRFFVSTVPIYLLILGYFIKIYSIYGSFQPSYKVYAPAKEVASSSFGAGSTPVTLMEDVVHYFGGLWKTWSGTYNSYYMLTRVEDAAIIYAVVLFLFVGAMILDVYKWIKEKGKSKEVINVAFGMVMIAIIIRQFISHYKIHSNGGYSGGWQSRYYMTCIPIMAMGACEATSFILEKSSKKIIVIEKYMIIALSMALLYFDFIYYIQNVYKFL